MDIQYTPRVKEDVGALFEAVGAPTDDRWLFSHPLSFSLSPSFSLR